MARTKSTGSLNAQNTFTDWAGFDGIFNLSVSGTWAGTLTIQRSFDAGVTPLDIKDYTANIETFGTTASDRETLYRIGFKTGNYTSGTAVLRISQ